MNQSLLIIFVKNPALGRAKTRLAASIGDKKALAIYKRLLARTHDVTLSLQSDIEVHYDQFIDTNDLWENDRFNKKIQVKGDLGQKMASAFEDAFIRGYQKVAIIGSDCYDLTTPILTESFDLLDANDFVIGPSLDGGYYLLGMKTYYAPVFENKQWSTNSVFNDTKEDLLKEGYSIAELRPLSDVDVKEDLGPWADKIVHS